VRGDRAQQVHAYRYQLLSLQPGCVRPLIACFRSAAGNVLYMVALSLRLWRGILHYPELRRGDLGQRHRPHHHSFHR